MNCQHIDKEIDPLLVPKCILSNGSKMPGIGFFTPVQGENARILTRKVLQAGYRNIDTASINGNEKYIGKALKEFLVKGWIKREQLWISSKVWFDIHAKVGESCKNSLTDLQLNYLDLYLLHWPYCSGQNSEKVSDALPNKYNHDHFMYAWRQMEQLVSNGLVKNIGTSHLSVSKLKLVLRDAKIKPVCNQMVVHPNFQNTELFKFCQSNNIQPIASSPLGSLVCHDNITCQFNQKIAKDEIFIKIAKRLNATPCQIAIKWAIQRGQVPITSSFNHFYEHIEAVVKVNLTEEDMEKISGIEKKLTKSKKEFVKQ